MTRRAALLLVAALVVAGTSACSVHDAPELASTSPGTASHVVASADDEDDDVAMLALMPGDGGETDRAPDEADDQRAVGTAVSLVALAVTLGAAVAPYLLF